MKSQTILLCQAVMAALAVITGASDLADLMPAHAARWLVLLVAAAATGLGVYTAKVGTMPADVQRIDRYRQ